MVVVRSLLVLCEFVQIRIGTKMGGEWCAECMMVKLGIGPHRAWLAMVDKGRCRVLRYSLAVSRIIFLKATRLRSAQFDTIDSHFTFRVQHRPFEFLRGVLA